MTKRVLMVCLILWLSWGIADAETVFIENFSSGQGQFSGFGANGCQWQTPGDFSTLLSYFDDEYYAEIARADCGLPTFWDQIVSDDIDLSEYENSELSFKHSFHGRSFTGLGNVEISTDSGANYFPVFVTAFPDDQGVETVSIAFADGSANVKIRISFWYYGGVLFDSYWGVDDVSITATPVGGDDDTVDDDTVDDDTVDDDTVDDDTVDDDTVDDDTVDDDTVDDDAVDDDAVDDDTVDDDTVDDDTVDDDTVDDDTVDDDTVDDDTVDDDTVDDDAVDDDAVDDDETDDDSDNILDDDDNVSSDDDDDDDDGGGCAC
ncbi:MAG TPA: hypothetical protein PKW95_17110 [bacterium]|nr:hypothetical protein [bacterium]